MSKFHTLMGALFDPFLFVLRLIANMSSPIYEQYRCSPSHRLTGRPLWKPNKVNKEPEAEPLDSHRTVTKEQLLMPPLQPEPLASMMSFQLMAMDVVSQMQSALHQCVAASQSPPGVKMAGLKLDALRRSCCFFIDLHPHSRHGFKESLDEPNSSQVSSDKNNNADVSGGSSTKAGCFRRQRSISECSEDSFICFEDDADEEDDKDGEDEDEDDDDDDDDISVQFTTCCEDEDTEQADEKTCACSSNDSSKSLKKVRFNLKPEVHVMHAWDYAYRAARKSKWEVIARDRSRFQQRIHRIAPFINAVLTPEHRDSVYQARFLMEEVRALH
ncbi:nucleolar transcription factor 1 [Drosophila serrata]|uniref:nucleolar transcription factor 1 n=1 Tax=Drosophila serrata TaxID=7274 RepID=UPI000A1CF84B|nr:nucleolar transcription factor 1 [Drosophila serrata]KAH8390427.1 hypothetical protein KR200_011984 [Drosophila serrata]